MTQSDATTKPQLIVNDLTSPKSSLPTILATLQTCRIHLSNLPISWLLEFRDCKGLEALLHVLQQRYYLLPLSDTTPSLHATPILTIDSNENTKGEYDAIQYECVRCLSGFMDFVRGMEDVMRDPNAMKHFARTLGSTNRKTVTHVLETMACVCLLNSDEMEFNGLRLTLDAMASLSVSHGGGFRFNPLVRLLAPILFFHPLSFVTFGH